MTLSGKGYYIWRISQCEYANSVGIAASAAIANLSHVMIKVANGPYIYWENDPYLLAVVSALKSINVEVWGWQWVYGLNPVAEAQIAIKQINALGLDGFVVNAESPYKQLGYQGLAVAAARNYMTTLRLALPDFPIALSTYRYPLWHRPFPFEEFLKQCTLNMPQVYWIYGVNPGYQLKRCYQEYKSLSVWREMVPTGAAFKEWGWASTPAQCLEFLNTAKQLGLSAANFWSWDQRRVLPSLWDAIAAYQWTPVTPPPPPAYTVWKLAPGVSALNVREVPYINDPAPAVLWTIIGDMTVKLTEERQGNWARLHGQPGWVNINYLVKVS
jgi:hypothetical protein